MKRLIFLLLFSLCLIPNGVYALQDTYNNHAGCTYSNMADLKEAAALVNFSYDYSKETLMTITVSNLQKDFYIVSSYDDVFGYNASSVTPGVISISDYTDGEIVSMSFYASTLSNCNGEKILIRTIRLPRHNIYYGREECEGIDADKFSLCGKWYPDEVNEATFLNNLYDYKDSLKENNAKNDNDKNNRNSIIELILNNYKYVLIGILGVSVVLIAVLYVKERKRRVI